MHDPPLPSRAAQVPPLHQAPLTHSNEDRQPVPPIGIVPPRTPAHALTIAWFSADPNVPQGHACSAAMQAEAFVESNVRLPWEYAPLSLGSWSSQPD